MLRCAVLLLALTSPAFADEAAPPAALPAKEAATLQSFAAAHPACSEWSDGCAVCKREGAAFHCSLPGIACEPADIVCKAP